MNLEDIQSAIRDEGLDAWLFFDHHRRDPLAYRILDLTNPGSVTRRWYYLIPAQGTPRSLVHAIEPSTLAELPGDTEIYSGWTAQTEALRKLLDGSRRVAMQFSPNCAVPYVSMVDGGTIDLIRWFGVEVVSSADLVQRFDARWTPEQLESHLEAGRRVDEVRRGAFAKVADALRSGTELDEYAVKLWVREAFDRAGLVIDHGPIVAVNEHTSNPHYEPESSGSHPIHSGDVLLLDMWAKLNQPHSVYYDITWTGYCGATPPDAVSNVFTVVRDARDAAFAVVRKRVAEGTRLQGFEVDDAAREHISSNGFGKYFIHRTGHSIGEEVHGTGANMDNLETHDERRVIADTCFSIEPGIYLPGFGIRSEFNVFVSATEARVTGETQTGSSSWSSSMRRAVFLAFFPFLSAWASEWRTFGADSQRTGWARSETQIAPANVGAMKLGWKLKLDNTARELTALCAPVIVEGLYTQKGVKDIVIVAGSSDRLFAIDADTGVLMWQKQFDVQGKPLQTPDWLCANALNATPVIDRDSRTAYVIASDGRLHALNVINGEDLLPLTPLVPAFSKPWSLNLLSGKLYASISQGCNGAKSGIYVMNLTSQTRPVSFFQSDTAGGGIWGRGGVSISDKTHLAYGSTGDGPWDPAAGKYADSVVAVGADGKLADYYTPENRAWLTHKDLDMGNTTPAIFPFGNRELLVAAGKEGVLYLLDTASLGGSDHRTPLYRSPRYTNEEQLFAGRGFWGAFATQEDADGVRWIYASAYGPLASDAPRFPTVHEDAPHGSLMAFNVIQDGDKTSLKPVWISHDMSVPDPPVVANGVVFALSTGEDTEQVHPSGRILTSAERMGKHTSKAVLYALDAKTGKELFTSGDSIATWTHFSGLAVSNGRVYVVTHDSTIYAFSVPQ